jgi:DeoR family transcriptional regulator, aga operon transcriptional repressor
VNRYERLNALLELLADRGRLDVEDVATELEVSAATVRRDFDHLAQQQLVTRTRGGAVAHSVAYDLPLRYKTQRHATEKQRIGRAAADLVGHGMVVGLNGGTTTTEVARAIATHADLNTRQDPSITVVTNALNIANELTVRPHVKIVVTGGVARPQSYELIGPLGTRILEDLSLDIAFLGVDGFDPDLGATAFHEGEANINNLIAHRARRVVVVADASKLGERAFARICAVTEVDTLITDAAASSQIIDRFRETAVEVIQA